MKRLLLLTAACVAAVPLLSAQEATKKVPLPADPTLAPPDPKTREHAALTLLAGSWEVTQRMTLPGQEQPTETKASERAELICNGLYLKSVFTGEFAGAPHHGVWIVGYDPHKKSYAGIWVDNHDPSPCRMEGRYDERTKTWEFSGSSPTMGQFRSSAVIKDADNIVETCVAKDPAGKETKCEVTRKRSKAAPPVDSVAKAGKAASKEHEELLRTVGDWDATIKMSMQPGAPPTEEKGTDHVIPICDGHYVWSEFKMTFQGMPFEGHGLTGYDVAQKKYVNFWFDSMSPTASESSGTNDAAKKVLTLTGTARDQAGNPATTKEIVAWKDDNTRHMSMEMKGEATESFEITFVRARSAKTR